MRRWNTKEIKEVLKRFPGLTYNRQRRCAEGTLNLLSSTGSVLESFELHIQFPGWYSDFIFPIVTELSDKIPRAVDRHMYPSGRMCLATDVDQAIAVDHGLTLSGFFKKSLLPFLATQIRITEGHISGFPQGERSHGTRGVLESYQELLEDDDPTTILEAINSHLDGNLHVTTVEKPIAKSTRLSVAPRGLLKKNYMDLSKWVEEGMQEEEGGFL
jgi:hypothetical protein